jgi:hypothetical protein
LRTNNVIADDKQLKKREMASLKRLAKKHNLQLIENQNAA